MNKQINAVELCQDLGEWYWQRVWPWGDRTKPKGPFGSREEAAKDALSYWPNCEVSENPRMDLGWMPMEL